MAQVDNLKPDNSRSELEENILHAVRGVLKAWNVYHAVWNIEIHRRNPFLLEITAWIDMRKTLAGNPDRPLMPINFTQVSSEPINKFTDVEFVPIARELAKEMNIARQQGPHYKAA